MVERGGGKFGAMAWRSAGGWKGRPVRLRRPLLRRGDRSGCVNWHTLSWLPALLVLLLGLGIPGCGGDPGTGPAEVKWDRFACDRCRMVLSDRQHSAQVRTRGGDRRSKVFFFDDVGCAIVWLRDHPSANEPGTEIWVTDWRSGDWIDARTASFVRGQVTPMEYGLGAQSDPLVEGLTFEEARAHVFDVEQRFNVHGVHLEAQGASRSGD